MDEISVVGQVVGGSFGDIIIRQKAGTNLEIGDLMVSEENGSFLILQVFSLEFGSQIQDKMQQMMSGVNLEQGVVDAHFWELSSICDKNSSNDSQICTLTDHVSSTIIL